jgi:disease resistance protein RPS2
MHDVVRDVAIWIASSFEDGCKSLVRSGIGLSEISVGVFSNSPQRVSFIDNKITMLPDCVIQCSKASTLLLQGNLALSKVPERFLQGFEGLRVLNISGTRIQSLPLSLLQLSDLLALLLRDCFYLEELPPLGGLSRLQVLDLCATRIRELPRGMENLSNLRQLDLSRIHYLKTIQAGIMSRLSCLEVLDMTLSAYHLSVNREVEEEQASFEELRCLERLLILCIRLDRIPCLSSENVNWINKLRRFQFFIGPTANSLPTRHDKRRVTISGLTLSGEWIGGLLGNASSLVLNHCWGWNEMLEVLVINSVGCFACLKSLTIASSNSSLQPEGGCAAHYDLLPNLEELHLQDLTYLESISELVGHHGLRFLRLKLIEVTRCSQLKYLISCGHFILTLPNLEVINVSFCDKLDELFNFRSTQNMSPHPVVPSLRILELKNLPKLRTLCRHKEKWQCLEQVDVFKCNLLRKLPLTNQCADIMKETIGESQWLSTLDWHDDITKSSLQPYFDPAEDKSSASQNLWK